MSGAGGSAGARQGPFTCEATTQWHCVNYTTGEGCHCDPSSPKTPEDCESIFAFTCEGDTYATNVAAPMGCSCLENALTPEDCERPEQFNCTHYFTYFVGCACQPGAPLTEADCEDRYCTQFQCRSEMPRYGCTCEHLGCIK